jgi:hypothetical protein
MAETRINISELKSEGGDMVKELATFLTEKTGTKIETGADEIVVKSEEADVSRAYLRVLLRKFLHKKDLKDYFRVIAGKNNALVVKERKIAAEEE